MRKGEEKSQLTIKNMEDKAADKIKDLETQVVAKITAIEKQIQSIMASASGGGNQGMLLQSGASTSGWRKPILESSIIQNLKRLGSDKTEYEMWRERLDNALDQLRP